MPSEVEIYAPLWADRHMPVSLVAEQARALKESGAVDGVHLPDHLVNFIAPQLWRPDVTPMANILRDPDSMSDAFAVAAYVLASAPGLRLSIGTDTIRRNPSELMQTMLTLANMSDGHAMFQFGAGEVKQCRPYGHKRSQGLSRMEDLFIILRKFLESDGEPFDYEGHRWNYQGATIGSAMPHRPQFLGLGAGPRLLDYTTSYADGLGIAVPSACPTPEAFAETRDKLRDMLEQKGRDPDAFRFALWFPIVMANDDALLEQTMANDLIRWITAVFGRVDTGDWGDLGLANPVPDGWTYYADFVPHETDQAFVDHVLATVTEDHVREGWTVGTADEIADRIQPYIEAGADWICPLNYTPMTLDPSAAPAAFAEELALYERIRSHAAVATASGADR